MKQSRSGPTEETPLDPSGGPRPAGDALLVAGEGRLSTHELREEVVIGRDPSCDIVVAHRSFSRRHARVRRGPPLTVQDLDSRNGTRVGTSTVRGGEPIAIHAGDAFHIGPFTFVLIARGRGEDPRVSGVESLRVADPTLDGAPALVREIAASPASVLLLGETGVGKEVLAETIHRLSRRSGPFVRINCAALTEPLLESELFGHERGAFTGATAAKTGLLEAAQGGTVLLDEVGELPAGIQAKLLRAVEQREVLRLGSTRPVGIDVRFVAATNRDLPAEVEAGRFRRDLFFRLDGVTLEIPPLRERRDLIGPLALRFLDEATRRGGRPGTQLGTEALAALEAYAWPGNVRELKAVVERAVLLARAAEIRVKHLSFAPRSPAPAAPRADEASGPNLTADERVDRERIVRALEQCGGNQTRAAKALGMSRSALVNRIRIYRLNRPRG
jgi:transcriptional regulator with PAS, ATPase and Fis domain